MFDSDDELERTSIFTGIQSKNMNLHDAQEDIHEENFDKESDNVEQKDNNDNDELIATQLIEDALEKPLKEVVAFVDVRGKDENQNDGIIKVLKQLGAQISKRLNKNVTHVWNEYFEYRPSIFKLGRQSTLTGAQKYNVHLVNVLWVDCCLTCWKRIDEGLYGLTNASKFGSETPTSAKLRRVKSMQPKPFEEELAINEKKLAKRRKRKEGQLKEPRDEVSTPVYDVPFIEFSPPTVLPDSSFYRRVINRRGTSRKALSSCTSSNTESPLASAGHYHSETTTVNSNSSYNTPGTDHSDVYNLSIGESPSENFSTNQNNRSSDDDVFQENVLPLTPTKTNRQSRSISSVISSKKRKKASIVLTSLHSHERIFAKASINQLGSFRLSDRVTTDTTHLINGAPRRTINLLLAIARGCWVVSPEWVSKSIETGHWVDEADFEFKSDIFRITNIPSTPAKKIVHALLIKLGRLTFMNCLDKESRINWTEHKKLIASNLFSDAPTMFISSTATPPNKDLTELVTLCGGKVTRTMRKATIFIGLINGRFALDHIKEEWILDSVVKGKMLPIDEYTKITVLPLPRTGSPEY